MRKIDLKHKTTARNTVYPGFFFRVSHNLHKWEKCIAFFNLCQLFLKSLIYEIVHEIISAYSKLTISNRFQKKNEKKIIAKITG